MGPAGDLPTGLTSVRRGKPRSLFVLLLRLLPLDLLELADPDVAEPHRVAMVLNVHRRARAMRRVLRRLIVERAAHELKVVLNDDPVVDHGHVSRPGQLLVITKSR